MSRPPPQTRKGQEFDLDNLRLAAKRSRSNTRRAKPLNEEVLRILDRLILIYTEELHGRATPVEAVPPPASAKTVPPAKKSA